MVAPLGRRPGRKSSQVRKICFGLWTWKSVVVAKLGNTRRSRVVTRSSPWTSQRGLTVWTRWKPHLQSQKIFGKIRKGVGNRSGFQDQSKVAKIQKVKVCHQKCQWEGPFEDYQRVWENWETTLWEKYIQTWANSRLLSSSKGNLQSVWWDLINSICMITEFILKRLIHHQTSMLRTRTNGKK